MVCVIVCSDDINRGHSLQLDYIDKATQNCLS